APIHEINLIRKSLSKIKGGRLGRFAANSSSVALYISDVNPGDLRSIASNPVLPEEVNPAKILDVVSRFDLMNQLPASVTRAIRNASTTTPTDPGCPEEPATLLLMDNSSAVGIAA